MELKYKNIITFIDILPILVISAIVIFCLWVTAAIIITKDNVIVNKNYKTDRILVKKYELFNNDSALLSYHKPIEYNAKVISVENKRLINIKFDNGQVWQVKVHTNTLKKYKKGQKIIIEKKFYPKMVSTIKGEESVIWKKQLNSK